MKAKAADPKNQRQRPKIRYALMLDCWDLLPNKRPSFAAICDRLGSLQCPYVDFPLDTPLPPHGEVD